ncbi:MAG: transglycosylase SLT domain-containing protein [Trueperaceae bacterium]|nr:transglycosylase SLT domain-containing protein [Trueperaceae bacterium]
MLRALLIVGLTAASLTFIALAQTWHRPATLSQPASQTVAHSVVLGLYESEPLLQPYERYRGALARGDTATLTALLGEVRGSYLEYRTLLALARYPSLSAAQRTDYYQQLMAVRLDDPLARADTSSLWLEHARTAEAAGLTEVAVRAYTAALPEAEAITGLRRLEPNPYTLANIYLQARQYRNALRALGGNAAPSIEAPAYRALGEHAQALDAYERWLAEIPNSDDARYGRAWSLFYLGRNDEAEAAFRDLSGSAALYARGILALRRGDIDETVRLYRLSGSPRYLWLATEILETRGRHREAIPIYLELATLDTSYADDAAYRALVLARRLGDNDSAARAEALLPLASYFSVLLGRDLEVPTTTTLAPAVRPAVLDLADRLESVGDLDAAIGELQFALRDATDEATTVALASELQRLGEFRQSQRAAEAWLNRGSRNLDTWRLAYPRAYPDTVQAASLRWNVNPELAWAIMREESRFYPKAVSRSGAKGLMQFMPATWDWMAEILRESPGDPFDPEDNIRYGVRYLSWLLDYFGGDLERVVPSYNGGQGYIRRLYAAAPVNQDKNEFYRFIDKTETREYLQKVMLSYAIYNELY